MTMHGDRTGPGRLVETATAALRGWTERMALRGQLSRMGPDETARMLRDSCLSQADLEGWLEAPYAADDLAARMMTAVGLEPEALQAAEPAMMREIERVCMSCGSRRHCRRSLEDGVAAEDHRSYCPNAGTFDLLPGPTV